jgi:phage shock protein PspC (stress-responsive transcriptional regulator)
MDAFARQGLVRPRHGRVIAGVCAGLARRLGLGPWLTRILFLLVNLLIPGSFLIVYVVLWVLMPPEDADGRR